MAEEQKRREAVSARAGRISSLLDAGSRPDPEDTDDRDDVAHHYAATLRPSLADLDPARKAAAIGAYVLDTGIGAGFEVQGQPVSCNGSGKGKGNMPFSYANPCRRAGLSTRIFCMRAGSVSI